MPDTLVILPTIRNPDFFRSYVENANEHSYDLGSLEVVVLTENFVDKSGYSRMLKECGLDGIVMNQSDRDAYMKQAGLAEFSDLFPKRSRAEESFALFYMWRTGHDFGLTVDDDTTAIPEVDFFGGHLANLKFTGRAVELSSDKGWVNVLHHRFSTHHLYPRGFPYGAMGEELCRKTAEVSRICISQGLWTNIPDLDAVRILIDGDLCGQSRTRMTISDYGENFVTAFGNYLTMCSMNLAFRRDVIPFFYQFRMGDNPWRIDRFDDIWSGVVAKRILDSLGCHVMTGTPFCQHNKTTRSTFKDLMSEAAGLEANETLYKIVDSASMDAKDPLDRTLSIAGALQRATNPFVSACGSDLNKWIELLRRAT